MAGRQVKRQRMAMLEEMGEEKVFNMYLECGTVRALIDELFDVRHKGADKPGHSHFYAWLHESDERWKRWQDVRRMRGHMEADKAYEEAESASEQDVRSKKLKVDTYKWRAGVLNREDYGDKVQHDVTHDVGDNWLKAVTEAKEEPEQLDEPERIEEADYTIEDEG